jgi:hypothetical protein
MLETAKTISGQKKLPDPHQYHASHASTCRMSAKGWLCNVMDNQCIMQSTPLIFL